MYLIVFIVGYILYKHYPKEHIGKKIGGGIILGSIIVGIIGIIGLFGITLSSLANNNDFGKTNTTFEQSGADQYGNDGLITNTKDKKGNPIRQY